MADRLPARLSPEGVRKLIVEHESLLREAWDRRIYETDMIILADAKLTTRMTNRKTSHPNRGTCNGASPRILLGG
jgi:hypothetical protein